MGKAAKSGSGNKVTNPMLAVDLELELSEEQVPEQDMSAAAMIEANASEMTEDELADLTYAFQAADMNGAGAVDSGEFMTMLQVMGCQISMEQVKGIIGESKDGFRAWKLVADEENVARCKATIACTFSNLSVHSTVLVSLQVRVPVQLCTVVYYFTS